MPFLYPALYLFYLSLFIFLILKQPFFALKGVSRKFVLFFFLMKVTAGIVLTWLYTYYYEDQSKADIYRYFIDSKVISSLFFQHPAVWLSAMTGFGLNEAETFRHLLPTLYFSHNESDMATNNTLIIRFISLCNYFSFYNIYLDTLLFNFVSFLGLVVLYKAFTRFFEDFPQLLLIPVFLMPSVVFWSSGLLKEQLVFVFLGPFFWIALNKEMRNYRRWILLLVVLLFIYHIKPFVAMSLLIAMFPVMLTNTGVPVKTSLIIFAILGFIGIVFLYTSSWSSFICEQLIDKRAEFTALAIAEKADSYSIGNISSRSCSSLISYLPIAFFKCLLQPFPWQNGTFLQLISAIENAAFILIIVILLFRYFKIPSQEFALMAFCLLTFVFINYSIIGISVPITGAIVHYRIVALPFLLMATLLFTSLREIKSFAQFDKL